MAIELVIDRKKPIDFTHNGRPLMARPMPLKLALSMQEPGDDGSLSVPVELMAKVISECVLFADDGQRVYTSDEILESDVSAMIPLFKAATQIFDAEEAEKN